MNQKNNKRTSITPHILSAGLVILLGLGNIFVGNYRHGAFLEAEQGAQTAIQEPLEEAFPLPLEPDLNNESKRQRKIDHRLKFYGFVVDGGILLVVSGSLYLLFIFISREIFNRHKS